MRHTQRVGYVFCTIKYYRVGFIQWDVEMYTNTTHTHTHIYIFLITQLKSGQSQIKFIAIRNIKQYKEMLMKQLSPTCFEAKNTASCYYLNKCEWSTVFRRVVLHLNHCPWLFNEVHIDHSCRDAALKHQVIYQMEKTEMKKNQNIHTHPFTS